MRMAHPIWWLRWRDVQRHVEDPATQVIAFIRSVSPPDREDPRAVEYVLSMITRQYEAGHGESCQGGAWPGKARNLARNWRNTNGNHPGTRRERGPNSES